MFVDCGKNQLDHGDDLQALKAELETRTVFPPVLLVSLVLVGVRVVFTSSLSLPSFLFPEET